MPPNVHTPGSAATPDPQVDVSAEMERAKEVMLNRVMGSMNRITLDRRKKIMALLAEKAPAAIRSKINGPLGEWTPDMVKDKEIDLSAEKPEIVRILLEQNAAIGDLIPELKDYKARRMELHGGGFTSLQQTLLDPESDDAKLLNIVYQQFDGKTNPEWKKILDPVELSAAEINRLKALEELRVEHASLSTDASFHSLGDKKLQLQKEYDSLTDLIRNATTPAPVPTGGAAPVISINTGASANSPVDIQKAFDRQREIGQQQTAIVAKGTELKSRLEALDAKGLAVANAVAPSRTTYALTPVTATTVDTFGQYSPLPFSWAAQKAKIETKEYSLEDWMRKPEAGADLSAFKVRAKRGKGKISANAALNEMLAENYRRAEPNASEAEIGEMVRQMRALMTKRSTTAPTAAAAATAATPGAAAAEEDKKKLYGSTWARSAYNWWWNIKDDKKEGEKAEKKKSSGSWWKSFKDYMNEDDHNLLGLPVEKKKS